MYSPDRKTRDRLLVIVFTVLATALYFLPTGFESHKDEEAVRCTAEVLHVDDDNIMRLGLILSGEQSVTLKILDGPFKGEEFDAHNQLMGQLDRDKLFKPGDTAYVVLTLGEDGRVIYANPQAHYRLGLELLLLGLFAGLLLLFGGMTGLKALLSFVFTGMVLWKVLVPLLLKGVDPVWLALSVVALLSAVIIFLVAGVNRTGLTAFVGAFLGVVSSCALAVFFTGKFHVHGAVMPFAETLLYAGYGHLDLTRIFMAGVFLASSGAVMDLAMDVASAMSEVVDKKPGISRTEAVWSGIRVGRAVVGTMTTTLLLAYSGGYVTLLMAFMAQGIPLDSTFNFIYVAAEVLKTLVGSFGLVAVAPFTALVGSLLLVGGETPQGALRH
ncbi:MULTISPECIES: YibE/F family protein [unclassified Pseudodesulfovibrio]|uniref:YibE/F family protein n=1 Tax=unclassified Pseudodesulfovibrio TaxID=2661612 RepID=UPI000FEBAF70|nr:MULTISPECIES: YibE/F family protein [unclassified Pseudodesulfovibrio]MCJ2164846.1 YibE/F family protein [Pseudodesulfovibrio sp. S3-i]RWU03786.1 YibE/F family protein [Pseudodesulfovibrio sp. S3]